MPLALAAALVLLSLVPGTPLAGKAVTDWPGSLQFARLPDVYPPSTPREFDQMPAKGKFLVATRRIKDMRFFETVILLTQYNKKGTVGLIINRPTKVSAYSLIPDVEGLKHKDLSIYYGGPVAMEQMWLLIQSGRQPEESLRVLGNVYVSTSITVLAHMLDGTYKGAAFRVYAGYAGWSPGQLERELSRGDWHLVEADAETVFDEAPRDIWPRLFRKASAIQAQK